MVINRAIKAYSDAVLDTDREKAIRVIQDALQEGLLVEDALFNVVIPSIEQMMDAVSLTADMNLAQYFMAAQIASEVVELLLLKFEKAPGIAGTVIIGNAHGDIHGLGKRIVIGYLKAYLYETYDLGLNVPAEQFVEEAAARNAQIIGISTMMVHTARGENGCLKVRQILKDRKLEDKIKIIVGGAPFKHDPTLYREVGADTWAENALEAGKVVGELVKDLKRAGNKQVPDQQRTEKQL